MRSLSALIWRNLTAHPLRSILTALAITLGVAMVLAASIVGQAAGQSAAGLSEEGPHVGLEVFSRDGAPFDDVVLGTLRAFPNVDRVSPSLRVEVEGIVPEITGLALLGVDPEAYQALHEPELAGGVFLDGSDTIVLPMKVAIDNRLNVGDEITLLVPSPDEGTANGQVATLTVVGRLKLEQDMAALTEETVAYVPLGVAQVLADAPGQVDHIEVALRPDADVEQARGDLAQAVGPNLVVVRAVAVEGAMGNVVLMQASLAIVGLIILFAASFVILNAFAMSVTGRTREIGALRALGMTRRQVLRTVMAEAGMLGLVGTTAGVLIGLGLAWAVMRTFGNLEDAPFAVPWWGLSLSALLGLAVTLVAALQPAWRASRVSPIVAVRSETTVSAGWYVRSGGRVGAILPVLLLLALAAYGLLVRPDAFTALAVMVVGQAALLGATVLLLPALVDPVTALCRPFLVRWLGTAGRLAADNLGRNKMRTVLTTGALTAGLTIIVATSGLMTAGLKGAISSMRSGTGNEDVMITADLAEVVASQELTFDNFFEFLTRDDLGFDLNPVVEALSPLVESGTIKVIRYRFQVVPPELSAAPGAPGLFVDPKVYLRIGNFDFFEGDPETVLEWMQRGRAVLLMPIVAERLGVQVGDDIPVQTAHGEVEFTVAGIGGGGLLMTIFPYADGEAYFNVTKPSFLGIVVADEQDVDTALERVEKAVEPFPQITLLDYDESLDPVLEVVDRLALLLDGLLLLAVVVAALGVVNTMVINVAERGREIGLLRAVGATQRQVRQAVVAEAATLGLLAALVADGLGLLMLLTYGVLILPGGTASLGVHANWETIRLTMGGGLRDWAIAAAVSLVFGPLVAALAAYYPARQAAAMDVVEATRSERVALKRTEIKRPEGRRRMMGHTRIARSLTWTMAWRNLEQQRSRTILSVLAVALGAAMTITGDVISDSILNALSDSEITQAVGVEVFEQLAVLLTLVGVAVTVAAGFLVFNTFAMSVTQRRQQIGALRSLGMIRSQVLRLVLIEALIIGGLGTLMGLVAGPLLGRGIMALLQATDMFLSTSGESSVSLSSFLLATVLGMGVTWLSVLIPARRATRISPLDALHTPEPAGIARNPVGPARMGLVVIIGLIVYLLIAPPGAWVTPPWDSLLTGLIVLVWVGSLALVLPALVGGSGNRVCQPLTHRWGATGRLVADNLQRGRRRVTLTIATLVVGLAMIVGMTGFITFFLEELFGRTMESSLQRRAWVISAVDPTEDVATLSELDSVQLVPEAVEEVRTVVDGRAEILEFHFVLVPELSFMGSNYFSFVLDPQALHKIGTTFFTFTEGNWETAMPVMENGCGLLLTPLVARNNDVRLGDTLTVQGAEGDVECTVAGIGATYIGASIISNAAAEAFDVREPLSLYVSLLPSVDSSQLESDLNALADRRPDVYVVQFDGVTEYIQKGIGQVRSMLNGLLLLAIAAAAIGVVNTTVLSVAERRRELGLLRAVGATQRQVSAVVAGEAALIGLIGGGLGLVAGAGVTVILATVYGGNAWGIPDLDLWGAAWRSVQPALLNGLVGLVAAPFMCAGAAWLPTRSILRGPAIGTMAAIETMEPECQPEIHRPRRKIAMRSINFLAWRNMEQGRTRTMLSVLAVALGAAMIVAASVTSEGVRSGVQASDVGRDATAWLTDTLELSLNTVGFVILVAAGFVIFNAFAMAITQRQQQIGTLRSLGMTRHQVMRLVLVEAWIAGGMGTLLGLIAGPLLGSGILALMRLAHMDIGPGRVSFTSIVLAIVMGVGITLLSVLIPARRATRISPLVALRASEATVTAPGVGRTPAIRGVVGLLIITGLTAYLIIAPPGEWTLPPWDVRMPLLLTILWLAALLLITPALIGMVGQVMREPLTRLAEATGRLVTDNLKRGRRRVTLTILTFVVGLTVIVSMTGIFTFTSKVLIARLAEGALEQSGLLVVPFDPSHTLLAEIDELNLETLALKSEVMDDFYNLVEGRAEIGEGFAVIAPEIGAVMSSYPSFIYDLDILTRPGFYTFAEGNWETALPIMKTGCGVLISPGVAARNQVGIGDTITLQGVTSLIDCTVAGIGAGGYHPASFISPAAKQAFDTQNPAALIIFPLPGTDRQALEADMQALAERHGADALVIEPQEAIELLFSDGSDMLISLLNSLLLLAVLAAAIGVVNTTVMSVTERRHELGLLRAVGATRAQVNAVVTGEAALMGLLGGGLGLVAGAGISVIFPVSFGGNSFGVVDLPLWEAAWQATQPALLSGLLGLIAAPLISAGAAWLPVRAVTRGPTIETMEPERQQAISPRRAVAGFLGRGSVRTRFVLGTATLMIIVLAGLIGVVTMHARIRTEEQMHDALRTMVTWNAGMIELGLPEDAKTLNFDILQTSQVFDFDSDTLLRFERLMDGLTEQGLDDFAIADRDNVVLISLDTRDIGTLAPELETRDEADVYSEREGDDWLIHATAPIRADRSGRADDGLVVGSVRLTIDAREIQDFLNRLRNTLGTIGTAIIFVGLAVSWGLSTPLARTTQQLAAHTAGVGRGEYTLFDHPKQRGLGSRFSLQIKLTVAMVFILVLMVGVLELVAIPIERRHVEDRLKDSMVAAAEWIGQAASESFDVELSDLSPGQFLTFEEMLNMTETLDLARLQELSDQLRSDDAAYTALVDEEGTIVLSDQLALIGEEAQVSPATQIEEATWRDEEVWVTSTPLRRGRDGELIGALRMAVRRDRVEAFLDESRNLFRLTGLIAVLAGVLLAQAIGGAVTAPVRQLAAGTRRVAAGDLSVQFDLRTNDELAMLAQAYNQMVIGLREREWLRDMFGRFVSQEVAEAIRTGQVKLEGENRVVSILFCDIRGFTARSERSTPEEVVALLNEYLPVVVDAAQRHEGTVNKFGGDSTLVIYGAPRRLQESAYQAVLTALEMRANLQALNAKLTERGEDPLRIGVGINTGVALAGAVGPEERQEYTVIGDTVNLASRIEALNKEYPDHDVLISGWTYEALGSRRSEFEFADLGEVQIRGKVEPVRVWAVVR